MLHECWIAPSRLILPCTALHLNVVPESAYAPLHVSDSSSAAWPSSSAASAVTNLNTEPGGYVIRSALSTNGLRGSDVSIVSSCRVRCPVMMFGSNDGFE